MYYKIHCAFTVVFSVLFENGSEDNLWKHNNAMGTQTGCRIFYTSTFLCSIQEISWRRMVRQSVSHHMLLFVKN